MTKHTSGDGMDDEMKMKHWQAINRLRDDESDEERAKFGDDFEYDPEMEMVGDKDEIDSILDSVIRMCGDPECDYEFAENVNALPSSVNPEDKDMSDMPPADVEDGIDLHAMDDDEDEHRSYGMRRSRS